MIETVIRLLKLLLCLLPFILFALLNMKANLKKQYRSCQFLMPVLTLVYSILLILFLGRINELLITFINGLPALLTDAGASLSAAEIGLLHPLGSALSALGTLLENLLQVVNPVYLSLFVANAALMLLHVILKRIIITWAILNSLGFIMAYVTPFFAGGTWTP